MITYKSIVEATKAAQEFFSENFNYNSGVGIEKQEGDRVEFYSQDDPGMDDTFTCLIEGKPIHEGF
jgi:hypothetical protein